MKLNLVGPFVVNAPFGTEIAFAKGLRRIGVEVIEVDPNLDTTLAGMHADADATVVFKSCVGHEEHLKRLKNSVIVYQPDDARFPHIQKMIQMMRQHSELFLSFDDYGATYAKSLGYRASETLLLTADDELYCPSPEPIERDIDVSFIGSLGDPVAHASRRRMLQVVGEKAKEKGWVTAFGTTQNIPEVLDIYRRSKVVLNHATDVGQPFGYGYGLQCRHFEVGMTKTPIISNIIPPLSGITVLPYYLFHGEESLIYGIDYVIKGHAEYGETLYAEIMRAHRPEHRAQQLVDFIKRNT